jgi:hypothetical protein
VRISTRTWRNPTFSLVRACFSLETCYRGGFGGRHCRGWQGCWQGDWQQELARGIAKEEFGEKRSSFEKFLKYTERLREIFLKSVFWEEESAKSFLEKFLVLKVFQKNFKIYRRLVGRIFLKRSFCRKEEFAKRNRQWRVAKEAFGEEESVKKLFIKIPHLKFI